MEDDIDKLIEEIGEGKHGKPDMLEETLGEEKYNKVIERQIEILKIKQLKN